MVDFDLSLQWHAIVLIRPTGPSAGRLVGRRESDDRTSTPLLGSPCKHRHRDGAACRRLPEPQPVAANPAILMPQSRGTVTDALSARSGTAALPRAPKEPKL